jgi:hypothetical protein
LAFDALAARFLAGAFLVLELEAFIALARPFFAAVFLAAFLTPADFAFVAIALSSRFAAQDEATCCGLVEVILCFAR